jgi:hypothetical protein
MQPNDVNAQVQQIIATHKNKGYVPNNSNEINDKAGGWQTGLKEQFDYAMLKKDAPTIEKLLPQVPHEYKERFADEIEKIIPGRQTLSEILGTKVDIKPEPQKQYSQGMENYFKGKNDQSNISDVIRSFNESIKDIKTPDGRKNMLVFANQIMNAPETNLELSPFKEKVANMVMGISPFMPIKGGAY